MGGFFGPDFDVGELSYSHALDRTVSGLTDRAVAIVGGDGGNVAVATSPKLSVSHLERRATDRVVAELAAQIRSVEQISLNDLDRRVLSGAFGASAASADGDWCGIALRFDNGGEDRVLLDLSKHQGRSPNFAIEFVKTIWPVLKEDCLAELGAGRETNADAALLWMVSDKIDVGVMVLNQKAMMVRVNLAARRSLESGALLKRSRYGLIAHCDAETQEFRKAVAECANSEDPMDERTIFVTHDPLGMRVPITLARYRHNGEPTRLVVALLPTPPASSSVEDLARGLGLTGSEAKVARLMQLGLTNREAAQIAGLKEQTFNTYAKRVLGKLNVGGRAQVAQLLTWQAAGRLLS